MPDLPAPDTDELIERVDRGDQAAAGLLLSRHRDRLRRMVAARIDPRLAARIDPSDVVQEALTVASERLLRYARRRPLAYYPWLRQIAWDCLQHQHARHVDAQKRSVTREAHSDMILSDASVMHLADRLVARGSSPSVRLQRAELHGHVRRVIDELAPADRELLLLHYLEQLTLREIADVLRTTEASVKMRHVRALERLRDLLGDLMGEV